MAHRAKEKAICSWEQNESSGTAGVAKPMVQAFAVRGLEEKADVLQAALERSLERGRHHLRLKIALEAEPGVQPRKGQAKRAQAGK